MPRSNSNSRSSSRSSSFSSRPSHFSRPSPVSATTPAQPVQYHEHKTSMGLLDGVKWGFGTSVGSSIARSFGFGSAPAANSAESASASTIKKDTYEQCLETFPFSTDEMSPIKKMEYCTSYNACMKGYPEADVYCRQKALEYIKNME